MPIGYAGNWELRWDTRAGYDSVSQSVKELHIGSPILSIFNALVNSTLGYISQQKPTRGPKHSWHNVDKNTMIMIVNMTLWN